MDVEAFWDMGEVGVVEEWKLSVRVRVGTRSGPNPTQLSPNKAMATADVHKR